MEKKPMNAKIAKIMGVFSICCFIAAFVFYFIMKLDLLGIIWCVAGAVDGLVALVGVADAKKSQKDE